MKRMWIGIVLVAVGAVLLLGSVTHFDVDEFVSQYWPAALILIGIFILIKKK